MMLSMFMTEKAMVMVQNDNDDDADEVGTVGTKESVSSLSLE